MWLLIYYFKITSAFTQREIAVLEVDLFSILPVLNPYGLHCCRVIVLYYHYVLPQVLVATFEVQCAMWVRNGLYMASQSLAHRQYFFSKFFIDADLFLVQVHSLVFIVVSILGKYFVFENFALCVCKVMHTCVILKTDKVALKVPKLFCWYKTFIALYMFCLLHEQLA